MTPTFWICFAIISVLAAYDYSRSVAKQDREDEFLRRYAVSLQRGKHGTPEELMTIDGVQSVSPGIPGEIVVICSWYSNPMRIHKAADLIIPDFCMLTVRRETVSEWWERKTDLDD